MRLTFEQDHKEDYFEIILTDKQLLDINTGKGAYGFCLGGLWDTKNLSIFIRKQNFGELEDAIG
jgi:hypothetical protein